MRKGFTLLELMIVIIIIGVLATVGIMQYTATIEKSRGAEARQVIGGLRTACAAIYMQDPAVQGTQDCTAANLRILTPAAADGVPGTCNVQRTNYFSYAVVPGAAAGDDTVVFTATRCTGGLGKLPSASAANTLTLTTDFGAGTDQWASTGGY
jgi:prepilin-type N-terminal cleavage/methylation domain-containing protein